MCLNALAAESLDDANRVTEGVTQTLVVNGPTAADPGGATGPVTAADVARFLPVDGVVHTEPKGWAVLGIPANVWVDVRAATVAGTLLGATADVRFTPVAYRWDYGDGTGRTTSTPGDSWSALGQPELTATATSHVYTARGALRVTVRVVYRAEYRVGGGAWLPVVGTVVAAEPDVPVQAVVEGTVLTTTGSG